MFLLMQYFYQFFENLILIILVWFTCYASKSISYLFSPSQLWIHFFFLLISQVQSLLPRSSWVWGHQLNHGGPTTGHILRQSWFSPPQKLSTVSKSSIKDDGLWALAFPCENADSAWLSEVYLWRSDSGHHFTNWAFFSVLEQWIFVMCESNKTCVKSI